MRHGRDTCPKAGEGVPTRVSLEAASPQGPCVSVSTSASALSHTPGRVPCLLDRQDVWAEGPAVFQATDRSHSSKETGFLSFLPGPRAWDLP